MTINWDSFPNFGEKEFACRCGCGVSAMQEPAIQTFQDLRTSYNRPLTVSSGYRCVAHPVETAKIDKGGRPGTHNSGYAVDFQVGGKDAIELLRLALNDPRVTGIGIQQKGPWSKRFLHFDILPAGEGGSPSRPHLWTY
jgi:uncharacterized protein YcbK (DUF882 family)